MKNWKGFERAVAKMVVDTFKDHGITNKDCYRTPMSGGHRYASKNDPGDLVISSKLRKLFPFHVECKCYATVNLAQFLFPVKLWKKSWKCSRWLDQVMVDSEKDESLIPLLVFKENNGEIMASFPVEMALHMLPTSGVGFYADTFAYRICFMYEGHEWIVVRFRTFLAKLKRIRS